MVVGGGVIILLPVELQAERRHRESRRQHAVADARDQVAVDHDAGEAEADRLGLLLQDMVPVELLGLLVLLRRLGC